MRKKWMVFDKVAMIGLVPVIYPTSMPMKKKPQFQGFPASEVM